MTSPKLYGPAGIGVLYGESEHLPSMPPFNGGGEMIREVSHSGVIYGDRPHRFDAGTPPIVQAIGLGAAIDYISSTGKVRIHRHENILAAYGQERLGDLNFVRMIGTAAEKGAINSFELKGTHAHDIATIVARAAASVRAGGAVRCRCTCISACWLRALCPSACTTHAKTSM